MNFSILATLDKPRPTNCRHRFPRLRALQVDRPRESDYRYLGEEGLRPWAHSMGQQASGILTRKEFDRLVDALDARYETDATLGTLGGPLTPWGGVVPDVAFHNECEECILSLRVTPVPSRGRTPTTEQDATRQWKRIVRALERLYMKGGGGEGGNARVFGIPANQVNRPPNGTFRGSNFMTPEVLSYYKLAAGWAELSSGRGMDNEPIYGVTVRHGQDERLDPDPSRLCHSLKEAHALIRALGGATQEDA